MRRARDLLWSATAVFLALGFMLGTGRIGRRGNPAFEPKPYAGSVLMALALFVLAPLALVATLLAWRRVAVWLGVARPRRRGAPKHAPPPDGPAA